MNKNRVKRYEIKKGR